MPNAIAERSAAWRRLARAGWRLPLALLLILGGAACRSSNEGQRPYRFIDALPPEQGSEWAVEEVSRRVLPREQVENRFTVPADAGPLLTFATGLEAGAEPRAVRFEVLLEDEDKQQTSVFRKDVHEPGWIEERVDLSGRSLGGASLVFRRSHVSGPPETLLFSGWGNPTLLPREPASRPSVILISLDTLRADFVGPYGRKSARTFALELLAQGGVLYEQAYSPSMWTVPSHTSLFYGLHLAETPALLWQRGLIPADSPIPSRPLADILRRDGFLTAGFTGGGFVFHPFDLPRGFEVYTGFRQPPGPADQCLPERFDGPRVFDRAQQWLRSNGRNPFFLFLHTYDVHDRCPFLGSNLLVGEQRALSPDRLQRLLDYYERLIGDTDAKVAALLKTLAELGLLETTLIVVTSDHGEAYYEHGVLGHSCEFKPYEEVVRVPLILHWPSRIAAGQRIATPVSLIDVAPTILALLGLPAEPWMRGALLPGLGLAGAPAAERAVFVHCGDQLAVRRGRHKLITSREGRYPDELYDLNLDPSERESVAHDAPLLARLRADAEQYWQSAVRDSPLAPGELEKLDPATKERLRALGYLD